MKVNVGDWALVGKGKKAHKMIQGYNGLCKRCTPFSHGGWYDKECSDYEQEDLKPAGDADKCKRCLSME